MARGKRRSGRCTRRNKQTRGQDVEEPKELTRAPHTFVIHRGKVGPYVRELVRDFRKVMEPFTASSLKVMKRNCLKDFVSVAGMLHVTHFCIFTRTDLGAYLKIARVPRGPTLSFKIHNYTLARDVLSSVKKQFVFGKQFEHPPLIVLNGFTGERKHVKLLTSTFQNMFPTINLIKVDLRNVRRCVLLNYDPATRLLDFRHFAIKVVPAGVSKSVKKIVQSRVPNLSHYKDISQYLTNPTQLSESEAEDDPASHVVLPQNLSSRGNIASNVSAVRVVEIGPRLTLELLKMEAGLLGGDVLFHNHVEKSEEEVIEIKKRLEKKRQLKIKRRRDQEGNIKKKIQKKQISDEKSLEGMKLKYRHKIEDTAFGTSNIHDKNSDSGDNKNDDNNEDDDDAKWYKEEVGQEPEPGLFTNDMDGSVKRRKPMLPQFVRKRMKESKDGILKNSQKTKPFVGKNKSDKLTGRKKVISSMEHKRYKQKSH